MLRYNPSFSSPALLLPAHPLAITDLISVSINWIVIYMFYMNEINRYSFSSLFFHQACLVVMYHSFFIHSPVREYLGIPVWAITNHAALNICHKSLNGQILLFLLEK